MERPVYGVVSDVATRSMDASRHPMPRGEFEESEEDVYLANPQLGRLLVTDVRCIVTGYQDVDSGIRRYIAPLPARVYSFVYLCSHDEIMEFVNSLEFLPILLAGTATESSDEVVAAFLLRASSSHPDAEQFKIEAGMELAALLSGEMDRLNLLLRRLSSD